MLGYRSIAAGEWGRVVPNKDHSGMWQSINVDGILSDTASLCRSKDNVMAQAIREVAWDAANDPRKCPVKGGLARRNRRPCVCFNHPRGEAAAPSVDSR
jgi:hypothetical protein